MAHQQSCRAAACRLRGEWPEHATTALKIGTEWCAVQLLCTTTILQRTPTPMAQLLHALLAWLCKGHPIHNTFGVHEFCLRLQFRYHSECPRFKYPRPTYN